MPPSPLGTEVCIERPLIFRIFKQSENEIELALAKAEYSPREWPAKYFALKISFLKSFLSKLIIDKLVKNIAGWVFSVKSRSSFGPFNINSDIGNFNISSASLNVSLIVLNFL